MAQILFPLFDRVIFAPIHSLRATPMSDLLAVAQATGTPAEAAESVSQALELARQRGGSVIVISGSVYLVGEARSLLLAHTRQPVGAEP
jgi:dihydrofolate synthase/folylpolyglutamate synthase